VYDYFQANPDQLPLIDWNLRASQNTQLYTDLVRKLIYPNWNTKIFQANKSPYHVFSTVDTWMFQSAADSRYMQSWYHGLDSLRRAIDPKYHQYHKDGKFDGWIGFVSPFYDLGPVG